MPALLRAAGEVMASTRCIPKQLSATSSAVALEPEAIYQADGMKRSWNKTLTSGRRKHSLRRNACISFGSERHVGCSCFLTLNSPAVGRGAGADIQSHIARQRTFEARIRVIHEDLSRISGCLELAEGHPLCCSENRWHECKTLCTAHVRMQLRVSQGLPADLRACRINRPLDRTRIHNATQPASKQRNTVQVRVQVSTAIASIIA